MESLAKSLGSAPWDTYIYAATTAAATIVYYLYTRYERRGKPPGPTPLPFVGNALGILGRPLHVTFAELQKKYGDIFCLKVAGVEVIVINGYENVREALVTQGKKFSDRPNITWTSITRKHGIFSSEGKRYTSQKSIVRRILTDVSWDKMEAAETRIQEVGDDLVKWLSTQEGKPISPQIYLDTAVSNVNSEPVIGTTFTPTDELMVAISKIVMEIFIDAGAQNVNNYFTFLRHVPGDPTNYHVLRNNAVTAMSVLEGVIKSHKLKMEESPSAAPADFIDHYLAVMKSGSEPSCTDEQLLAVVTDLIAMGVEATATTLRWAILLLCQHPDTQAKIQRDVDEVMGSSTPSLEHQQEMAFTNSAITEIQRFVNLVSINLPHSTSEEVEFKGYIIPKGAVVLPNLASVHYDTETYPDPLTFKPDRFLEDGEFQKPEKFLPYSAGTRVCLGKNLSQWELFLFLTKVLQRFDVKLATEATSDVYGLIRMPGEFKCVFSERKHN